MVDISLAINTDLAHDILTGFIKSEVTRIGMIRAVVGLSGGLDSALSCKLAAEALGVENVLAVRLPYKASNRDSLEHAQLLVDQVGVQCKTIEITDMVEPLFKLDSELTKMRKGNILARQRMIILYDQSEVFKGLVIGTSNKTEILLGYSTLYGDSASAMNPIGDLYKTQVRQLSQALNIPAPIINKPPSADLWEGQTDENELGFSYEEVDKLLYLLVDQRFSPHEAIEAGFDEKFVNIVTERIRRNQFKRMQPPIAKVSNRTVGYDFLYLRDWGTYEMRLHVPPSLKHKRFFYLWLGQLISVTGTQMQLWALFWHINQLDKNPIALGGIGLARILPVIIFSLIGGALADSYDRRKVLFVTQSSAALLALTLGLLTQFGHVTIWHIYVITAFQAIAVAFDGPSRQALIPNLVPKKDLPNAFSMTFTSFQIGSVLGPALTGFVIAFAGQAAVYYFNAISFLSVLIALILIGDVSQKISEKTAGVSVQAIREGIHFILSKPIILSSMMLDFVATFFASANTLMPIIAKDVLQVGVLEYGYLSAAPAVGAVIVALIISQIKDLRRQGPLFLGAVLVFGLATILFGVTRSFVVAWLAIATTGAADGVSTIIRNTIRQLQTPDHIRGRMTSVNQIFFQGGPQLGEMEAGTVAQFFGAPFAVISGGIGCIVGMLLIVWKWPQLTKYNGDEPMLAGATAD